MTAPAQRRGACPALSAPMQTGDGLLVRLNPVAGGFSPKALIGLCESAARHGNGILETTQRGSIQIRGLSRESARKLADEVDALGIAVRTGMPVEVGPLAGLDPEEIADPRPLVEAIRSAVESAGLSPRLGPKVSVIVDGGGRIGMGDLLADVRLTAVRQEQETFWHMAVGGTAAAARPVGSFAEADACDAVIEILQAIAALGREGRGRDIAAGRTPTPTPSPPGGGEAAAPESPSPLWGGVRGGGARPSPLCSVLSTFPLTNTTHALGIALPFGAMPAENLAELAQQAADLDMTEFRPAPGRMLLVLGLRCDSATTLETKADALGFVTDVADPRLHVAACPGQPACVSGHIETRAIAEQIAQRNADLLDGSFTLHVSGCAKGCAHPGPAALTLVGGENDAGLVVNGTAKTLPAGYVSRYDAARGLGRVAAMVQTARRPDETTAACLARLGAAAIATAFAQNRHVRG